jgi:hypothetical protein
MSGLFGKKPEPAPVVKMPVPADTQQKAAEDRKKREIMSRSGRASTVLTRGSGASAGTAAYQNSLLGQAG